VGRCRKISAALWTSDGPKTAAEAGAQGSSRRGRPGRLRALNFRYKNINAAINETIAMNFNAPREMETITPSRPTS
jgi:hypothetical protein